MQQKMLLKPCFGSVFACGFLLGKPPARRGKN